MVEKDWDNRVEATMGLPNTEMSVEGFFMNLVIIDKNRQVIPATHLHSVDHCLPDVDKEKSRPSKGSKPKERRKSVYSNKLNMKDVKVCLDNSRSWVSKLANVNIRICTPDMQIIKAKNRVRGKRKGSSGDGDVDENGNEKKQKSSPRETPARKCKTVKKSISKPEIMAGSRQRSKRSLNETCDQADCTVAGTKARRGAKEKETAGADKKKPEESHKNILQQSFNTSMCLRVNHRYWINKGSDDESDESWSIRSKSSKKKTTRKKTKKVISKEVTERQQAKKKEKEDEMATKKAKREEEMEKKAKKKEKDDEMAAKKAKREEEMAEKKAKNEKEKNERKMNAQSDEKKNLRQRKVKEASQSTVKEKNSKDQTQNGKEKKTASPVKEDVPKPEDCVVTAKRGTLKYLKQREKYVKAVAKEAECEDDFFGAVNFNKKSKLNDLILPNSNESLTIKTPKGKIQSPSSDNCVITPRTSLLGQWGVTQQSSTAYTPSTRSPLADKTADKNAIMETMFHQLKGRGGRCQGAKSFRKKNQSAYESVLHNPNTVIELPDLPEISELEDYSHDDYFEEADF